MDQKTWPGFKCAGHTRCIWTETANNECSVFSPTHLRHTDITCITVEPSLLFNYLNRVAFYSVTTVKLIRKQSDIVMWTAGNALNSHLLLM